MTTLTRRLLATAACAAAVSLFVWWLRPDSPATAAPSLAAPAGSATPPPPPAGTPTAISTATVADIGRDARAETAPLDPAAACDRFDAWLARFLAAPAGERAALLAEGRALAAERRVALAGLIRRDPQQALARAVPVVARQRLPAEIVALLEERVNARGSLGVLGVVGAPAETAPIRRVVEIPGAPRYEAYVFGRRATQPTTAAINVNGIALDRALALDERPLRVLEAGEIPDPAKTRVDVCLVSGKTAGAATTPGGSPPAITADTPAVEIGGTVHYVCNGGHIQLIEERLVAAEGASGGAIKPTTAISSTQSTGVRSLLYMRVTFPDSNRDPQTETAAYETMRQVNDWFVENSYGNLYLVTTVAPLVVLPRSEAWYTGGGGDEYDLRSDAQEVARRLGYDTNQYDLDIVAYTGGPGGFGGLGYVGGKGSWIKSISVGVICHELGHNFGVWHANFWNTSGASVIGAGSNSEYGNPFDTMGSAGAGDLHFNANHKSLLNWLPAGPFVHPVNASGVYRIFAYDQNRLDPANRYALRVAKDSDREYWAEFRQRSLSSNRWTKDGVLLNWSAWAASNSGSQLLDVTPGSPDDRTDAALVIGRTFSDREAGVHLTPLGKGGTTPESIDVAVNLGTFPGNNAPTLAVAANATTAAVNATLTFTATATDPDGDALAYAWDFGDKNFSNTNSAVVTKSWAAAGDYAVRCTVSDRKGGTASRTVVVRIGAPTTFKLAGQITLGGQPLADVRVHNGLTGTSYRGAYTDADGTYVITGMTAGSYTVGASLDGYAFTAGFTNPVAVGADVAGVNFTAAATPTVALAVTDGDCAEGGNTGRFTLTRTGPTASALAVRFLFPTGTATKGTDYTLAPDLVSASPYYTATIPAGAATLDLTVNPVDDATSEGPDRLALEMVPGPGYAIAGPSAATLVLRDNDTANPMVTLQVVDPTAVESGDPAVFRVSRTAPFTGALTVAFSTGGTATAGTDYAALGTSVTIPDGAESALLTVTPLNDSAVEGSETVTVTLSTNAAYVRSPLAAESTATVNLLDDEIPTLTVVATDAAAAEAGADPGVFTITRTGDTGAALTVNYALSGSAAQGVDYVPVAGVLTIPAGAASGTVTITPMNDALGEPAQTVVLQLRGGTGCVVGSPSNATITITDDGDPPVVTLGLSDATAGEPADTGAFRFTTTGTGAGNITVKYTVTGTATSGADFTALAGTLSMGRNTTATVTLTPLDDALLEDAESVTVTLTPDPAYSLHLDASATLRLVDNDQPIVNVAADNTAFNESGSAGRFWISRTGATTADLVVNFTLGGTATNGADYTAVPTSATIPAGAAGVAVTLAPINDTVAEGTETAVLALAPGAYGFGLASATLYLVDNEAPSLQVRFPATTGTGAETVGTVNVAVTLSGAAPAGGVTVEYLLGGGSALGGLDYQFTPGVLTFAAGESAKTIPLTILDDPWIEPAQTVILRLQNANGAALGSSQFTYTITDDDPTLPTVTIAATTPAAEFGAVSGTFTATRTGSTLAPLVVKFSVGGTATAGADYAALAGTVTIPTGQASATITVVPVADALAEGNETVIATLTADPAYVVGAPSVATLTLEDRPIDAWRFAKFAAQANTPAIAGDLADPDGDGLVNLLEYASAGDPWTFTAGPAVAIQDGQLALTWRRALDAIDITRAFEAATTPAAPWVPASPTEEVTANDGTAETVVSKVPLDPAGLGFLRLRVTRL